MLFYCLPALENSRRIWNILLSCAFSPFGYNPVISDITSCPITQLIKGGYFTAENADPVKKKRLKKCPPSNKGRTIRKVKGGKEGGGNFQVARIFFFLLTTYAWIFFFAHYLCTNFFQRVKPSARIFFFHTNIAFFSAKSWFIIYFCSL